MTTLDEEMLWDLSESTLGQSIRADTKTNDAASDSDDDDDDIFLRSDDNRSQLDTYVLDVRNINMYSLDTRNRKGLHLSALPRAEEFYSCREDATPVLHDTAIQVNIVRWVETVPAHVELMTNATAEPIESIQVIILLRKNSRTDQNSFFDSHSR